MLSDHFMVYVLLGYVGNERAGFADCSALVFYRIHLTLIVNTT